MRPVVVLDACVLYPAALRDVLLRCAEAGMFSPIWSESILAETTGAIARNRPDILPARLLRLRDLMIDAFPEAMVELAPLEVTLPDSNDAHVLAAVIAGTASVLVTLNVRHFPIETIRALTRAEVLTPDEFLLGLVAEDSEAMIEVIRRAAEDLKNPPISVSELLDPVANQAPEFCCRLRALL